MSMGGVVSGTEASAGGSCKGFILGLDKRSQKHPKVSQSVTRFSFTKKAQNSKFLTYPG